MEEITSDNRPLAVSFLDELEKQGRLKIIIDSGIIKSRLKRAVRIWKMVDVQKRVHKVSKTVAVQFVAEQEGCSDRTVYSFLRLAENPNEKTTAKISEGFASVKSV